MMDLGQLTLSDLREGFAVQSRIIGALIMREMRTRFGERQFGYAWALIEPLVQIGILVAIFSALGRRPALGTSFETFFLNGYVAYSLYTQISNRAAAAITANKALVSFPPVKNMDTVWARIILEIATGMTSFSLLVAIFAYFGIPIIPHDIVQYFFGFSTVILLGAATGIFNAALNPIFGWWQLIYGWLSQLQYFFSGVFFLADSLPPGARYYLMWNPLAHGIIWVREGFYDGYESPVLEKWYPLLIAAVLAILGLAIERIFRRHLDLR